MILIIRVVVGIILRLFIVQSVPSERRTSAELCVGIAAAQVMKKGRQVLTPGTQACGLFDEGNEASQLRSNTLKIRSLRTGHYNNVIRRHEQQQMGDETGACESRDLSRQ